MRSDNTSSISHETPVTYYKGATTLSGAPAVLLWRDATITLAMTAKGSDTPHIVFSCRPQQITNVTIKGTALVFRMKGKGYTVDTSPLKSRLATGALGGVLGGVVAILGMGMPFFARLHPANDWWVSHLKGAGVPILQSKLFIVILAALLIVVALLLMTAQ